MPDTRDVGSLFFHTMRLAVAKRFVVYRDFTYELEYPFRISRSIIFVLFGRALVLGRWRPNDEVNEQVHIATAIGATDMDVELAVIREW